MSARTRLTRETPRAAAKRQQIRLAARPLFLERGFEGTSMDAITAAAGISKRTLYQHYPSKEALLGDIVHHLTVGGADRAAKPATTAVVTTPAELEAALYQVARAIAANHREPEFLALVRIIAAETPRFPQLAEQYRDAVIAPGLALLRRLIDQARAQGVPLTADSESAVRLFVGGMLFWTYNALLSPGEPRWPTPEELREHARLVVAAVT